MKLVVGLGNPGNRYSNTRHNVGFMVLDQIAKEENLKFKKSKLFDSVELRSLVLIKPTTYMNDSGRAVISAMSSMRSGGFKPDDILVIVDDIYLPTGKIRLRDHSGAGGHNGLKSMIESIGGNQFKRLKIGVSKPETETLHGWVLKRLTNEELVEITPSIELSVKLVRLFEKGDYQDLLNYYSAECGKKLKDT